MIHKLIHWMRLVVPRFELVLIFFLFAGFLEALNALIVVNQWDVDDKFYFVRLVLYSLFALIYGVYRAVVFHPRVNTEYGKWLASTPWTSRLPLPAGPIHLVPQDLVVLMLIWGLNHEFSLRSLAIFVVFLSSYQFILALIHLELDEWRLGYAVGLGLGTELFFIRHQEVQLPIAMACYVLNWIALQRTLRRFPWASTSIPMLKELNSKEQKTQIHLGFPHNVLAPKPVKLYIPRHHAICLPILIGWWQLAGLWGADREARIGCLMFPLCGLIAMMFVQGVVGTLGYRSPIDLWGRICTGRIIIPKYDCVWVPSLVALAIGMPLYWLALATETQNKWVGPAFSPDQTTLLMLQASLGPLATTCMLLALLNIGPGIDEWRLTGQHRIVPVKIRSEFIEI